jgi:phage terminase small subunit
MTVGTLTGLQSAFTVKYVENGGNGTKAAIEAGYGPKGAHVRASELLRLPHIQAEITKLCRVMLAVSAPKAIKVLGELAVSASSDSVKLQASISLLDRAGYRHHEKIEISDHRTQADVDRELGILLGLDIQGETVEEVH